MLRAVALLGVGVIHAGAWVTAADAPPGLNAMAAVSELARFCVPAFVFASGFLLFHAYGQRPFRRGEFLKRRWLRVLLPWSCCVPLFMALDARQGDLSIAPYAVGHWLASGPGHLYFLLLIAQLYLLFLALPRETNRLRIATAVLVALQLVLMAWHSHSSAEGLAAALGYEEAPFWMGTFSLGCLTAAEWPRLARLARFWPIAVVASAISGCLVLLEGQTIAPIAANEGSSAYLWPSRLPQTVIWCLTLLWLGRILLSQAGCIEQAARQLSTHSLGIYLLHPLFLTALGPWTSGLPTVARVPLLLGASFSGAYGLVRLLTLWRGTALVIGEQPPVRRRARGSNLLPQAA